MDRWIDGQMDRWRFEKGWAEGGNSTMGTGKDSAAVQRECDNTKRRSLEARLNQGPMCMGCDEAITVQ